MSTSKNYNKSIYKEKIIKEKLVTVVVGAVGMWISTIKLVSVDKYVKNKLWIIYKIKYQVIHIIIKNIIKKRYPHIIRRFSIGLC